jgi:hypothetical protein
MISLQCKRLQPKRHKKQLSTNSLGSQGKRQFLSVVSSSAFTHLIITAPTNIRTIGELKSNFMGHRVTRSVSDQVISKQLHENGSLNSTVPGSTTQIPQKRDNRVEVS